MKHWHWITVAGLVMLIGGASPRAQPPSGDKPNFTGSWVLDQDLSDNPQQVGFPSSNSGQTSPRSGGGGRRGGSGGGFGGRGGFGGGVFGGGSGGGRQQPQMSQDERNKIEELTNEVKNPSSSLLISQDASSLIITDSHGRERVFQTNGKKDPHQYDSGTIDSQTKWDGNRLVTEYDLGSGRTLRYTYSIVANTKQLLEQVEFVGQARTSAPIKRVYDPAPAKPH
jgi:hypothetical protein